MSLELILTAAGVVIAVITFVIPHWRSESVRVRQAIREAEPDIYFHVSSYSGSGGFGYLLNIKNRSAATAHQLVAYLPAVDGVAWEETELKPNESKAPQIGLPADSAIRRIAIPGTPSRICRSPKLQSFSASS
jgi:hypothetical protein